LTAASAAQATGLHVNVARHHLDKLAAAGHLIIRLDRAPKAGRPSKRYEYTNNDGGFEFPTRRDDLLGILLGRALDRLPKEDVAKLADEVCFEYGFDLAAEIDPSEAKESLKAAVATVAETLTSHGFAARIEDSDGQLRITSDHCPFGQVAIDNPILCAIDGGLVRGMLAGLHGHSDPQLEESTPMGHSSCPTSL